jgi:hypothetical protein
VRDPTSVRKMLADRAGAVGAKPYLAASGHLVIGTQMVGQDSTGAPLFARTSAEHHPDCPCEKEKNQ